MARRTRQRSRTGEQTPYSSSRRTPAPSTASPADRPPAARANIATQLKRLAAGIRRTRCHAQQQDRSASLDAIHDKRQIKLVAEARHLADAVAFIEALAAATRHPARRADAARNEGRRCRNRYAFRPPWSGAHERLLWQIRQWSRRLEAGGGAGPCGACSAGVGISAGDAPAQSSSARPPRGAAQTAHAGDAGILAPLDPIATLPPAS